MREKVLTVIVDFGRKSKWRVEDIQKELDELVIASRGEVIDCYVCRTDKVSAASLISSGKVKEIAGLCVLKNIETVIFSHELKASQQRNIEKVVKVKTIDRTQLILDIFARHAKSQEGKMQVELAQLQYLLPRLVGKGIELSRLGGGIGTLGPGETKLESDRRRISQRITNLKRDLKEVESTREIKRKRRKEKGVPMVSLVGYTNAGKSTLINALTEANRLTTDGLFTTLDSLSRQLVLPNNQKIVLSDTVGFIHELPHHLVESFKATLEEVKQSDLLIHVLDISHPNFRHLYDAVLDVLNQLEVIDKPTIIALNKTDSIEDKKMLKNIQDNFENSVCISALKKENLDELQERLSKMLCALMQNVDIYLPIKRMDLVNLAHQEGQVFSVKYYNDKVHLRAALPVQLIGKFESISVKEK